MGVGQLSLTKGLHEIFDKERHLFVALFVFAFGVDGEGVDGLLEDRGQFRRRLFGPAAGFGKRGEEVFHQHFSMDHWDNHPEFDARIATCAAVVIVDFDWSPQNEDGHPESLLVYALEPYAGAWWAKGFSFHKDSEFAQSFMTDYVCAMADKRPREGGVHWTRSIVKTNHATGERTFVGYMVHVFHWKWEDWRPLLWWEWLRQGEVPALRSALVEFWFGVPAMY